MNYFIAPRSGEKSYKNFKSTIKSGVNLRIIAKYLTSEGLQKLSREDVIYSWGNRSGKKSEWEQMGDGDTVIFYAKGKLVMAGEVYFKQHSKELALAMWPRDEKGNAWEFTFFLRNLKYINIPMVMFRKLVGWKENFTVQGFTHLKDERISAILKQYGSVEKLLNDFNNDLSDEVPLSNEAVIVNLPKEIKPLIITNAAIQPKITDKVIPSKDKVSHKINYIERNKTNAITGSKGEELVLNAEIERLTNMSRKDLAEKVKRISLEDDGAGFDIISFEKDSKERHIEVKTSVSKSKGIRFYFSANEYTTAKNLVNYYIYLVEAVNSNRPIITILKDPINRSLFTLRPDMYLVEGQKN